MSSARTITKSTPISEQEHTLSYAAHSQLSTLSCRSNAYAPTSSYFLALSQCATIVVSSCVAALLVHMPDSPNVRIVGRHEEPQVENPVRHSPTFPSSHALSLSIGTQPSPKLCNTATTTSRSQQG